MNELNNFILLRDQIVLLTEIAGYCLGIFLIIFIAGFISFFVIDFLIREVLIGNIKQAFKKPQDFSPNSEALIKARLDALEWGVKLQEDSRKPEGAVAIGDTILHPAINHDPAIRFEKTKRKPKKRKKTKKTRRS